MKKRAAGTRLSATLLLLGTVCLSGPASGQPAAAANGVGRHCTIGGWFFGADQHGTVLRAEPTASSPAVGMLPPLSSYDGGPQWGRGSEFSVLEGQDGWLRIAELNVPTPVLSNGEPVDVTWVRAKLDGWIASEAAHFVLQTRRGRERPDATSKILLESDAWYGPVAWKRVADCAGEWIEIDHGDAAQLERAWFRGVCGPGETGCDGVRQAARLDCRVRHEDCALAAAIVEETIRTDPALAALRQEIDMRLAELRQQQSEVAAAALAEDEARYRRSLQRELYILGGGTALGLEDRETLVARLTTRLGLLRRMGPMARDLTGYWSNASGSLEIQQSASGRYHVFANPVDIDHLKWTCEITGEGSLANGAVVAELGAGEQLELQLADGLLQSTHRYAGGSHFCGASGHASGLWFPSAAIETLEPLQ